MINATDLATGTLFGSCAFNMVIFFSMDLAYGKGSVFGALDRVMLSSVHCR
jgi:Ca2+/Na+ antiporter